MFVQKEGRWKLNSFVFNEVKKRKGRNEKNKRSVYNEMIASNGRERFQEQQKRSIRIRCCNS